MREILVPVRAGLCDSCIHQKVIRTTRGSAFSMCERSKTDPRYPKYPRVPVLECRGYEKRASDGEGALASSQRSSNHPRRMW